MKANRLIAVLILIAAWMPCKILDAETKHIQERPSSVCVTSVNDNILPLKDLSQIQIVVDEDKASAFCHTSKLYAPVTIDKKLESDAKVYILPIIDDSKSQMHIVEKALQTDKTVIAVMLCNNDIAKNYVQIFSSRAPEAIIYSPGDELIAAEAIFGGYDMTINNKHVAATRLGYTSPEMVGVNAKIMHDVDSLVKISLETGAFPGCQVIMGRHGKIFLNGNYGYTDPDKKHAVNDFTIYDLASVSKATGTLPGIMLAYDRGMISLDSPASTYIKDLRETDKADITIKQLLFHETGMQPSLSMYDAMLDPESYNDNLFAKRKDKVHTIKVAKNTYGNKKAQLRKDVLSKHKTQHHNLEIAKGIWGSRETYDTIMHKIYNSKLNDNKNYNYSCLNFCMLMNVEEKASGERHDKFIAENIYAPLGAYHTGYRPFERFDLDQIAPTEYDPLLRKQKVHGYTHDELACFSGGVQGNAGLFSNATDLAKLCQMWLNNGSYGNTQILSEATVKRFTTEKSPTCRRGLGFDKPDMNNPDNSPTCIEADASVYGHVGYTGTIFWVDPKNDMFFIFLCNRVNPTRDNKAFNELNIRPKLFKTLYDNLNR